MSRERFMRGDGECGGNAAPYVLGALPEAEAEAFVAHLAECAVCREEVAALSTVAAALPAAPPQFEAPPELKRRLFAEIDAEARVPSHAGRGRTPSRPRPQWLRLGSPRVLAGAGVAVLAAVAVVLVIALGGSGMGARPRLVQAAVSAPGATASVAINGDHAELRVAHMPQVQAGRVYEVWLKRVGAPEPTDALFAVSTNGKATVGIPGGVRGVREVLVTSEPQGGSRAPTRAPVLVARL